MLSGISRNPCGARRDHTQHALIPLLRALWARVYLPTRRTRLVIAYTAYTPTNVVSDIRIRDRYCNLDELSPRRYYGELKIGKVLREKSLLETGNYLSAKSFEVNIFYMGIHTCIFAYRISARERNNYDAATMRRALPSRVVTGTPQFGHYYGSHFTTQWWKIRL